MAAAINGENGIRLSERNDGVASIEAAAYEISSVWRKISMKMAAAAWRLLCTAQRRNSIVAKAIMACEKKAKISSNNGSVGVRGDDGGVAVVTAWRKKTSAIKQHGSVIKHEKASNSERKQRKQRQRHDRRRWRDVTCASASAINVMKAAAKNVSAYKKRKSENERRSAMAKIKAKAKSKASSGSSWQQR